MGASLNLIFDSPYRAKILKLFIAHPGQVFATKEIAKRVKAPTNRMRRELNILKNSKIIRQKTTKYENRKVTGWYLNVEHTLINPLSLLLSGDQKSILGNLSKRFKDVGRMKLMVVSGVFLGRDDSRADIFIVGDKLKAGRIGTIIKKLEADVGRELTYALVDTKEFNYRLAAYDRFVRDVLDCPHQKVLNKMGIS
tara:strand:+ start:10603 stop:11190 length:588 start_codon:yes stop_codon:yes gene_type:complete